MKMHGNGKMEWPDDRKYEGQYFKDKKTWNWNILLVGWKKIPQSPEKWKTAWKGIVLPLFGIKEDKAVGRRSASQLDLISMRLVCLIDVMSSICC